MPNKENSEETKLFNLLEEFHKNKEPPTNKDE
jgi:hypothetical protein